ncbi:MAG: hypothetical protein QXQ19_00475 [Candidatus Aenigmatarchaeota archaeon]
MKASAYAILYILVVLAVAGFLWAVLSKALNSILPALPQVENASQYFSGYETWVENLPTFYGYLYMLLPLIITLGAVITIYTLALLT